MNPTDLWTWLGITSAIGTVLYYIYYCYCEFTARPCGVSVFVETEDGIPVTTVHIRLDNGKIVEVDKCGNAILPVDSVGKLISIRDRATNQELRVFSVPKISQQNGPLEIVVPSKLVKK